MHLLYNYEETLDISTYLDRQYFFLLRQAYVYDIYRTDSIMHTSIHILAIQKFIIKNNYCIVNVLYRP